MSVEMKDSGIDWIEEIPKHWNMLMLKNAVSIKRGGSPRPIEEYISDIGYNWIKIGDTTKGSKYIFSCQVKIKESGLSKTRKVQVDDLILTNSMSFGEPYILKIDGCIHDGWVVFSDYKNIDKEFLYYFLLSPFCKQQFDLQVAGGVVQNLNIDKIGTTLLLLPPKEEQSRIANFLDKKCAEIDELIALQEQMIAQLNTYKQAVITETVTKGLDPNVKMKDSGVEWIGEIPEHWGICRIKNLCREEQYAIKTGPFGTQLKGDDLKEEGDVCVYNQRNVIDADFNKVHSYVLIEKANSLKSFFTKPNDLLITTRGTIGRTAVLTKDYPMGILHPCLIALRIKQEISLNWLRYFFQTECFKTDILLSSNATTIEVIYTDNLKKVFVPFPPVVEQQSIAQYLDQKCKEIDDLISIKKEKIEHLKAYKKSVIYEYVTGKKQV